MYNVAPSAHDVQIEKALGPSQRAPLPDVLGRAEWLCVCSSKPGVIDYFQSKLISILVS